MAARRVKRGGAVSADALLLRATLMANTHAAGPSDPLRLRRDALDREFRSLRSRPKAFVEAID